MPPLLVAAPPVPMVVVPPLPIDVVPPVAMTPPVAMAPPVPVAVTPPVAVSPPVPRVPPLPALFPADELHPSNSAANPSPTSARTPIRACMTVLGSKCDPRRHYICASIRRLRARRQAWGGDGTPSSYKGIHRHGDDDDE